MNSVVAALLFFGGLGHDDYAVREFSSSAVAFLDRTADPLVLFAAESADFEVRRRGLAEAERRGLDPLERKVAELWRHLCRDGPSRWPWLDSHPNFGSQNASMFLDRGGDANAPDYAAYRAATEGMVRWSLANGETVESLKPVLDAMVEGDRLQVARMRSHK